MPLYRSDKVIWYHKFDKTPTDTKTGNKWTESNVIYGNCIVNSGIALPYGNTAAKLYYNNTGQYPNGSGIEARRIFQVCWLSGINQNNNNLSVGWTVTLGNTAHDHGIQLKRLSNGCAINMHSYTTSQSSLNGTLYIMNDPLKWHFFAAYGIISGGNGSGWLSMDGGPWQLLVSGALPQSTNALKYPSILVYRPTSLSASVDELAVWGDIDMPDVSVVSGMYLLGLNGLPLDSPLPHSGGLASFICGTERQSGYIPLCIDSYLSTSGEVDLAVPCVYDLYSGQIPLWTTSIDGLNFNTDLYLNGHLSVSGYLDLFTTSSEQTSGNLPLILVGSESLSGNLPLFTTSFDVSSGQIPLLISSSFDLVSGNIDAFIDSSLIQSGAIDLVISGELISSLFSGHIPLISNAYTSCSEQLDLYNIGYDSVSGDIPLSIYKAYDPLSGTVFSVLTGYGSESGYVPICINGLSETSGLLNLYLSGYVGDVTIFNSIPLYEYGYMPLSGSIPLAMIYPSFTRGTLNCYIHGVFSSSGNNYDFTIEDLIRTSSYHPQILGRFDSYVSGTVYIQVWELTKEPYQLVDIYNSGCYPIGDTGRWAWSTEYLPPWDITHPQYFYRMYAGNGESFDGQFFMKNPHSKQFYPSKDEQYIFSNY